MDLTNDVQVCILTCKKSFFSSSGWSSSDSGGKSGMNQAELVPVSSLVSDLGHFALNENLFHVWKL